MEHLWKLVAGVAGIWAIVATTLRVAANRELATSRNLMNEIWPLVKGNAASIQAVQITEASCRSEIRATLKALAEDIHEIKAKINGFVPPPGTRKGG